MSGRMPKMVLIGEIVLIVLLAGVASFFAWKYFTTSSDKKDDDAATTARVVEQVGALYALPSNEEPTIAQIQDKDKLQDQTFFDRAENGDYLLVYPKTGVALLYRESWGKLVNVGPVSIPQEGTGEVAGEATEQKQNESN